MTIYTLKLRITNLKDYNINIDKSNIENLLIPKTLLNINNIEIKIPNDKISAPQLYINYDQYPYYDIDKLENNITTFSNKNTIKNPLVNIFSSYDLSNNIENLSNFLEDKYTKSIDTQTTERVSSMKKKAIENIKKFVSNEKSTDSIDISKYITFYNIDFLLKNYIFKKSDRNIIKLYEQNNSTLLSYLVNDFTYIIPSGNNNPNFKINNESKQIILSIKLNLKKEIITNQLVIKLSLRGDITTLKNSEQERKKNFEQKVKDMISTSELDDIDFKNSDDLQKKQEEEKEKVRNKLLKSINSNTYEEYLEFDPKNLSDLYKSYKDIYLDIKYGLNERIFNNYIFKNNIKDIPNVFFDLSQNNSFKNYINTEKIKQNQNVKDGKLINPNTELKLLNINNDFISPNKDNKIETKNIKYETILENLKNKNLPNIDSYKIGLSDNIKVILNNLIKKNIFINSKEYKIIKKEFNYDKDKNLKFEFHRSKDKVNNKIDNVYQVIITLYLLDANKKNNLYNRQKIMCKSNNHNLIDNFNESDFSGNKLIRKYLENKRTKLTAGNNNIKIKNITYKYRKIKKYNLFKKKTIKNKFILNKKQAKKNKNKSNKNKSNKKKTIKYNKILFHNKSIKIKNKK
tara:strand:- start:5162 stop:7048 length:1887 start_codon:yes stop_codon:yes gene_type:complete